MNEKTKGKISAAICAALVCFIFTLTVYFVKDDSERWKADLRRLTSECAARKCPAPMSPVWRWSRDHGVSACLCEVVPQ